MISYDYGSMMFDFKKITKTVLLNTECGTYQSNEFEKLRLIKIHLRILWREVINTH